MQADPTESLAIVGKSSRGRVLKRRISHEESENAQKLTKWERKNLRLTRLEDEEETPQNVIRARSLTPTLEQDEFQMIVEGDSILYECGEGPYSRALKREKSFMRNTKNSKFGINKKKFTRGSKKKNSANMSQSTRNLVELIFHDQIFKNQISRMYLDLRLRSLKKIDRARVLMANLVLCAIEKAITEGQDINDLYNLSKSFYSIIKHDFGWLPPPVINTLAMVSHKRKVLMTLNDILTTQQLKNFGEIDSRDNCGNVEELYKILKTELTPIKKSSQEFKIIESYANAPVGSNNTQFKLVDVWSVDSQADRRFDAHKHISYRKLLWRATGAANVAATLREGLRIPTYSGKLGKGLYFNSNFLKALSHAEIDPILKEDGAKVGYLFLSEVALGRRKVFKDFRPSFVSPPEGFNSVIGRGTTEPNPKKNNLRIINGNKVILPVGSPTAQKKYRMSKFRHSKYVVYDQSQAKIRYLLKFHIYQ